MAETFTITIPEPGYSFELIHYPVPTEYFRGENVREMVRWICSITGSRTCQHCHRHEPHYPYCRGAGATATDAIKEAEAMLRAVEAAT